MKLAKIDPKLVLEGNEPRLIDEFTWFQLQH